MPGLARKARGLHPRGRAGVSLALGSSIVVVGLLLIPSPARGAQRAAPDGVEVRLPPDLVFKQTVGDSAAVVFRHPTHAAFSGGQCVTCHPQPFKILHPTHRTSHAEMNAGRSCGICHNGRQAFGAADQARCQSCHVGEGKTAAGAAPAAVAAKAAAPPSAKAAGPAAPAAGPADVALRQGPGSPGAVTFQHRTHAAARLPCDQCHPALFAMQAGATPLHKAAMREGKACGACHDGKKAFGVGDGAQCARCHTAGRAAR